MAAVPKSILSPEMAIRNAWARTFVLSSNTALQINNEIITAKNQIKTILENAQTFEEIKYVNEVISAIESTFRNLATARNHYTLNLAELDKRRQKSIEDLDSTTTVSSDFQSLISRISAITFGGTGGLTAWGFLVNLSQGLFPKLDHVDTVYLPLFLVTGAALGYILHNLWFVPWKAKKIQKQLIRTDYDQIKYYNFYIRRVKSALEELFNLTNSYYKENFGVDYYNPADSKKADSCTVSVLKSAEMEGFLCQSIDEHIDDERLDGDTWLLCETGQDANCKIRKDQKPAENALLRFFKRVRNRSKTSASE